MLTITTTQRPGMDLELSYGAALSVTVQTYVFSEWDPAMSALSDAESNRVASDGMESLQIEVDFEVMS